MQADRQALGVLRLLCTAKQENYEIIYRNERINKQYEDVIKPMFAEIYYKLLDDLKNKDENSIIYKHHIAFMDKELKYK